jgi:hypothetical protein
LIHILYELLRQTRIFAKSFHPPIQLSVPYHFIFKFLVG